MSNDDLMMKIGKLLNLAENAGTAEEAEAFMNKAQTLGTQYAVDLAKARAAVAKSQKRETPIKRMVDVADYKSKTKKFMVELYLAIARHNDLRVDICHGSSAVVVYGFESDMDVVEALFNSLSVQMVGQANEWLATGEYKNEMDTKWDPKTWQWVEKPVDGRVARASFYRGFITALSNRLRDARAETLAKMQEADEASGVEGPGTDLVMVTKAEDVQGYYKSTSQARGSWSGSASGQSSSSGRGAGRAAGESATISRTTAMAGNRKGINA